MRETQLFKLQKNLLNSIFWFIKASILLDIKFLCVSDWSLLQKLEFLFKKYLEILLLISGFHKFKLGENFVVLFEKKVFYDSPYGLAGYQSILARHQKMIKDAKIKGVKTIVDVGANVGFFSMMIRNRFPKAKIYAIEPVPKIFKCLKNNLDGSLDKVFDLVISNKNGTEKIVFNELESAVSHVLISEQEEKDGEIVKVKAKTLDQFCADNNIDFIDILKIDTESFEANVLQGAQKILSKTKYLHIEITIENNKNYTFSQINSLLYSKNFNFQLVCFRNYTDKGDGPIPVGDFFYKNLMLN